MTMIAIESKLIDSIDYREEDAILTVFFSNGHRRELYDVPKGKVVGLTVAGSPGSYYMSELRQHQRH